MTAVQGFYRRTLGILLAWAFCCCCGTLNAQSAKVETEIVAFTPHGFNPAKVTRGPGPFVLSLHHTAKYGSLEFSLNDSTGKSVKTVKLGSQVGHSQQFPLTLSPGTYTMRITELPAHTMQLVISAN